MDITTTIGNCVWPVKKTWHVGGSVLTKALLWD